MWAFFVPKSRIPVGWKWFSAPQFAKKAYGLPASRPYLAHEHGSCFARENLRKPKANELVRFAEVPPSFEKSK